MNIEQELKRIKYKENWTFQTREDVKWGIPDSIEWMMTARVVDVTNSGSMTKISAATLIPFDQWFDKTPEDLFRFCLQLIKDLEDHEAEEWFKIDGASFVDAHRNDPPEMRGK